MPHKYDIKYNNRLCMMSNTSGWTTRSDLLEWVMLLNPYIFVLKSSFNALNAKKDETTNP